ncbi:cytochrome c biogenesis protein ResB [Streptomyces alkaliterrae]|uniref:Cytochrome c biogenesis protein ResB n=1 Tax=Streptomyces alkaliterrae TaxID=2213162 RepID=A0A5P0YST0_9ACTN|nr:cytochrome c biogenesis protein ResB [Streptomyces alkaliterrae]MBB1257405.1 cytochrome c biogenesis protein ResB [Streptomyces alkaliterrae]MQS03338.1 cytochrome c biogenesis protein ResB [Streptomyces alkaliterrae]
MSETETRTSEVAATATGDGDTDESAAQAQLGTAPVEEPPSGPAIGLVGWLRWFWRQLTSMRVALLLLLLLSLASVPGSLIPQRDASANRVAQFMKDNPTLGEVYDRLQLFEVYSSVWFSAIYLLLFVSLIGCIVPRTWQFAGQLRARPPKAPARLGRMPAYTTWRTDAAPKDVLADANKLLRGRRFRVSDGEGSVAAEKGYLREAGNLVFHLALIVMLIAFATGQLWRVEGGKLVVKGDSFTNVLPSYDDIKSGSLFDYGDLDSFGFTLDDFHSAFEPTGPQRGTPREFSAKVTYWEGADGPEKKASIEVNRPLTVGDSKVYLLGHGYAPVVTVRDGQGDIAFRGPVPFLPQDANITSQGVVKVTDYRDAKGKKDQLAFVGIFTPTFGLDEVRGPHSTFPDLNYPALFLSPYRGDLGMETGLPQNVYQLNDKAMEPFTTKDGDILRESLRPGETMKLPGGAGTLKFERVERWATFQISKKPGTTWALVGAIAAVVGLAGSLFLQRRRVWVRARTDEDGRTVVEMAALGRSESAKLPEELGALAEQLRTTAPLADPCEADDDVPAGSGDTGPKRKNDSDTHEGVEK